MLVPNQLIEVKVIGITLEHYRNLGYDVNIFDTIMVPPEHLTDGSKCIVQVKCDICGENIPRPYKRYLKRHQYDLDTCNKCKSYKSKQTCMDRYGVETPMQIEEVKDKIKNTLLGKYGVDNPSKSEIIQNKKISTFQEKYGVDNPMKADIVRDKIKATLSDKYGCENPMQNEEIKQKAMRTNIKKYGVTNPNKNPIIQEKVRQTNLLKYGVSCVLQDDVVKRKIAQTNLERYGVKNPFESPMIQQKIIDTRYQNGTIPTSIPQLKLYEVVKTVYGNAELNYPFDKLALDIFIQIGDVKIDIEYDGWYWHQDSHKDYKRDKFLYNNGFKVLRVKSCTMLPAEQELFDAIDYLVNTKHHFKEIILSDWKKEVDLCQEQLQVVM